jgi:hypothetical protein
MHWLYQWFREESCRWEYPVYETVKYIRDVKTGKINERIYHFVVSTVSNFTKLLIYIAQLLVECLLCDWIFWVRVGIIEK